MIVFNNILLENALVPPTLLSCRSTYFARALDSLLAVVTALLDLPSTASKGSQLFIPFSLLSIYSIFNIHERRH